LTVIDTPGFGDYVNNRDSWMPIIEFLDDHRWHLARRRDDRANPAVIFEIEGELWGQPVPVQLFLETAIEVETRVAVVSEMRDTR
jgi:hypothetical protein